MELRQALRNRDSLVKKIATSNGKNNQMGYSEVKNGSHLTI